MSNIMTPHSPSPISLGSLGKVRAEFVTQAVALFPNQTVFSRKQIRQIANSLGKTSLPLWIVQDPTRKISHGMYSIPECSPEGNTQTATIAIVEAPIANEKATMNLATSAIRGMTCGDRETIVPQVSDEYVSWGHFKDLEKIVKTGTFFPVYITGMSGNGKTMMVEQVCAKLNRECFRVNIVADTDEDDLLGGFRLIDGSTVWEDGPAVQAMRSGAVLLLDEVDLGTSKLMCLQPILEGKGVYLKKINEWVRPAPGFTVFATANTKGKGSDDGRFIGTNIMNEAMLDRFAFTYEQDYPPRATEAKILQKVMKKSESVDDDFADCLTKWAEMIRKLFDEGAIDEIISTRRLVNIVQAYSVFKDKKKALTLCLARFDAETNAAFISSYGKIDASFAPTSAEQTPSTETTQNV